ncbi:MAG TPA: aminodeoxychorismate/anthranilate synthase component II, partial [Saprospiraceae bacterium]|nr:aminodeoxychorismate/anthranilate synthase component II [Saprospiraceae bacterium]
MKTKILLIDNRDSFTYNLVQLLEESGGLVEVIREEAWNPEFIMQYSRFVFSPGPGIPSDFPLMFRILEQLPATSYVLGICLGHQAIAEYFGGTLFRQTRVQHGQV